MNREPNKIFNIFRKILITNRFSNYHGRDYQLIELRSGHFKIIFLAKSYYISIERVSPEGKLLICIDEISGIAGKSFFCSNYSKSLDSIEDVLKNGLY